LQRLETQVSLGFSFVRDYLKAPARPGLSFHSLCVGGKTAALRDFDPAYDSFGSSATEAG